MSGDVLSGLAIKRISTSDQVASLLRDRILRGEIKPGTALREVTLAGSIGVSRNTLREALRILMHDGLVRHTVHRGITVTRLSRDDVTEIYRVRRLLEVQGAEKGHPNEAQLRELKEAVDELEKAAEERDWPKLVDHDLRFHRLIVALLGSARLDEFYEKLLAELRLVLVTTDRSTRNVAEMAGEHRKLCNRLAAGKRKEAARQVDVHLAKAERYVRVMAGD